jgi:hypothetical protein
VKNLTLAIDLCTAEGTLAIGVLGEEPTLERVIPGENKHQENILVCLKEMFRELNVDRMESIVVASGPGSYTGIRIAYVTAKALCEVWKVALGEAPRQGSAGKLLQGWEGIAEKKWYATPEEMREAAPTYGKEDKFS